MTASIETLAATPNNTKPLWAAVGILGVAVLAMGGGLIYTQTRPAPAPPAVVAAASALPLETAPPVLPALAAPAAGQADLVAPPPKPPVVAVKPKPPARTVHAAAPVYVTPPPPIPAPYPAVAVASGGNPAPEGVPSVIAENAPVVAHQAIARPVCVHCGTIENVTPVERQGKGGGVGAVAGGVLGAVVGNQIGHGSGRTVATLLGALGGGFAGNAVEKNVKKETVYQVRIRMEDGSTRTIEQATLPSVGSRVTVDNGVMHSAYGN